MPQMQRFLAILAACFVALVAAQPAGTYSRPDVVTGNPDWWVANHRSPCPALNSLANHGFINRNGKGVKKNDLKNAMKNVFNLDENLATFLVQDLGNEFSLADISRHNFIEHDASLVHADVFYKQNPAQVDGGLANDLFARIDSNRRLGIREVGEALRARLIWCQQKQGGCDFKTNQRDITFREAAKLLMIFGNRDAKSIVVEHAFSFLVNEQIPSDWKKPSRAINRDELEKTSVEVQRVAGVASVFRR